MMCCSCLQDGLEGPEPGEGVLPPVQEPGDRARTDRDMPTDDHITDAKAAGSNRLPFSAVRVLDPAQILGQGRDEPAMDLEYGHPQR